MASPDWLHSIRSELRELSRQVSQTRDLQQQILSQQATERAERQQFEYRIKNNVEQRLGNLENAMHQFLKEHHSTVMFQHQLDHNAGRPTDAITSLVQATRTSPLTNHNLFQRVPLQSFRAEIDDKFGDSRTLTTFPSDPLRPQYSSPAPLSAHTSSPPVSQSRNSSLPVNNAASPNPNMSMRPVPAFAYHEPPPPSQDVVWRDPDGDLHSVCRRCGLRFNINRNNDYQCGLHPGYFNPKTRQYACCGVIDIDSPNIAPIFCTFKPHLA